MFLLLILPILVSGFIVCNTNPNYYYKLHRYEGQYLYLKSAQFGAISLILFSLIAFSLNKMIPILFSFFEWDFSISILALVKILLTEVAHSESEQGLTQFSWVIIISVGSILYSYAWSSVSKFLLRFKAGTSDKSRILLMSNALSDSPLDKILFESYINSSPLLLTLGSRKVYVGTINSLGEPNESEGMDQEISIIPLMSGYRSKETLEVKFTTYYDAIGADLKIVIRQEQILSATLFSFEVYEKFNLDK